MKNKKKKKTLATAVVRLQFSSKMKNCGYFIYANFFIRQNNGCESFKRECIQNFSKNTVDSDGSTDNYHLIMNIFRFSFIW